MSDKKITGQLIIRNASETGGADKSPAGPGKKLIMVFGVLAVPEDFPLEGEHQYVTLGHVSETLGVVLSVLPEYGQPLANYKRDLEGYRPDQLLTARIWKV